MQLSRPRVLLRITLLTVGGAFMLWRAAQLHHAGGAPGSPDALAARMALVGALVGVLALLTAGAAALSLRRRPPKRTLTWGDPGRGPPRDGANRQ